MRPAPHISVVTAILIFAAIVVASYLFQSGSKLELPFGEPFGANAETSTPARADSGAGDGYSVDLSDSQLSAVKVEPAGEREFPIERQAVGSIDFNEDMTLQVFTPYQGRIIGLFAKVGDDCADLRSFAALVSWALISRPSGPCSRCKMIQIGHAGRWIKLRALGLRTFSNGLKASRR
jgi:hypothetical protein